MKYEAVMGLEVHAQLLTHSKIFCGCSTAFGCDPNVNVCPVCLGLPGALPVLNKKVVEYTMKMALATNCTIRQHSIFARKNYFYPDLPKGYQISQFELPIAEHGHIEIDFDGENKRIGITRIHMEEDAGKSIHLGSQPVSLVDLNRACVPLIEIVSEPDLRSPGEAGAYVRKIRSILQYLEICDGNMEEGSLRCDANVSVRPVGQTTLGTKTELKNLNSFKFMEKGLEYEINRQIETLEEGGRIVQETRLYDSSTGKTFPMRSKEEAHDYRYFPDPDLVPLVIDDNWIEEVKKDLPELADDKARRFVGSYKIPEYDAKVLTTSKALANYFEACVAEYPNAKIISNWIMSELLRELKNDNREIEECPIIPAHLSALVKMIDSNVISGKIAKQVFEEMYKTGKEPKAIVEESGLVQITDEAQIEKVIDEILASSQKQLSQYKEGKTNLFGYFVGQAMKATQGKANPKIVNQILKRKLET